MFPQASPLRGPRPPLSGWVASSPARDGAGTAGFGCKRSRVERDRSALRGCFAPSASEAALSFASSASITARGARLRNQNTAGVSRLPSFDRRAEERSGARGTFERDMGMTTDAPLDRVAERQRAVALARHFREAEGLSIAQIAARLGRAPATVKGYFYDPS